MNDEQTEACPEPEVDKLFRMMMEYEASYLHLKVNQPAIIRIHGNIWRVDMLPIAQEEMEKLLLPILNPRQEKILAEEAGVDFYYIIGADECRFRVSLFRLRGRLQLVAVQDDFGDAGTSCQGGFHSPNPCADRHAVARVT
jgi:twitching motility protein PilT